MSLSEGDVVWIRTGNQHEEPGTVLKVGCARNDDESEMSTSDEQGSSVNDGILVKLNVSNHRGIYAPDRVRPLHEDADTPGVAQRGRRRSLVTPSPNLSETPAEEKKPAAKRKSGDSMKKPPPKTIKTAVTIKAKESPFFLEKKEAAAEDADDEESDEKPAAKPRKPAAKTQKTNKRSSSPHTADPSKAKKKQSVSTNAAIRPTSSSSRSSTSNESESEQKQSADPSKTKKKQSVSTAAAIRPASSSSSSSSESESGQEESDDDRPFSVEYAPTGRATCRRCDEAITKGSIRVSHVPLFRGKPGFQVHRHLECAIFSEEVNCAQDVGGWRHLSKGDRELLALRIEESRMELEQENQELEPDELVQVNFQGEMRQPPPGLTANLLPFQTEGVSWMYCQEVNVSDIRGGILADEMGMGKTLQTITTILDNRPVLQHSKPGAKHPPAATDVQAREREETLWGTSLLEWKHEMDMNNVPRKMRPKKGGMRAGTLVVCPVVALSQWKAEIEKFTDGSLTVIIYHGPNRAKETPPEVLQKYDIVLTTYQVIEQDFRKMVSPNKVTCPNCGGKFKIDKLKVHLKYFCGEGAQRTEAQARQQRTADRRGRPSQGNNRGTGKGNLKKKPSMTKTSTKAKKVVRVKRSAGYDSDSELSVDKDMADVTPGRRPSRTAAMTASKKLSSSVQTWGVAVSKSKTSDDDESSFGSESNIDSSEEESDVDSSGEESDVDSSDDMVLSNLVKKTKQKAPKSLSAKKRRVSEIDWSSEDEPLQRAREKQRQAMANTKKSKKAPQSKGKKKAPLKKKGKKAPPKKKGKRKKFESSSDSSSDDCSDEDVDPMADIDMEKLVEEAMSGSRFSPLHSFCWWRLVLDEAHYIKSRSSQTAASAFALSGIHRWCLSGTPLQNRVGELYSLIRFLRIDPMAHYFCRMKDCSCKSIHYRIKEGKCQDCGHRPFSHYSHFNKYILNPIQRDGYTGDGRRAMFKLKTDLLDKCMLRRTKETRAADMNLPPRIVTIRTIRLHPIEEDFYNALYTQTRSSFDDYVAEGTLLNNYAHIFDLLTKMRQAVDHPYLIVYSKKNMDNRQQQVANGTVDCEICHEAPTERVLTTCCGSGMCRSCVIEYLAGAGGENTPCPSCNAPFSIDLNQESAADTIDDATLTLAPKSDGDDKTAMPSLKELTHVQTGSILRRINLADFATSSKIEVLIQELVEMRQQRPGSKALVFSQFVNMLDLVRWRLYSDPCLSEMGLGVRILHGGMDVKSRDQALKDFREDNNVRVLLMSLKAGGVALNLTVASEAHIMDLWWNPAAEMQAIDRTHRLGQFRPIRAVRYVAEGTVEERVLQLQEKKRLVFDGTVGRDAGSLKMLTVNDMKALFA